MVERLLGDLTDSRSAPHNLVTYAIDEIDDQRSFRDGLDAVVVIIQPQTVAVTPTGTVPDTESITYSCGSVTLNFVLFLDVEVDDQVGLGPHGRRRVTASIHLAVYGTLQGLGRQALVAILVRSGLRHEGIGVIARQVGVD